MPGLAVRYVQPLGTRQLASALENTVERVHSRFFDSKRWGAWWDHWLDQHIGIWYGGPKNECLLRARAVKSALSQSAVPVASRLEPDAYLMYTGYAPGAMSWEYQFAHCTLDATDPAECACNANNVWIEGTPCNKSRPKDWCL